MRDPIMFWAALALAAGLGGLAVTIAEREWPRTACPALVPSAATQEARLDAFRHCVSDACAGGPATFSPGSVVDACLRAAVELVPGEGEQAGPVKP